MLRALMAASVAVTLTVAPARAAEEINFGIISTEASSNLKKIWDPFLADMEKGTGLKVNAFFASDYAGVIEAMRFNKVQIAWFGNKSAMEAVDRAERRGVRPDRRRQRRRRLLVAHHRAQGQPVPEASTTCSSATRPWTSASATPTPPRASWCPTTFIFSAKSIDPKQCFKTVRNANHEANALAVANKLVHVATNNSENLERLAKTAPEKAKEIRVIWTSPLIPSDPLVWRKDLDAGLKKKIGDWLFAYGTRPMPRRRSWPTCSGRPSRSPTTTSCCRSARWSSTRTS